MEVDKNESDIECPVGKVFCRLEYIEGSLEAHDDASKYMTPPNTKQLKEVVVYVRDFKGAYVYLECNYVTDRFDFPTKTACNDPSFNLEKLLVNMIFYDQDSIWREGFDMHDFKISFINDFNYYIDESLLANEKYKFLDIPKDLKNVTYIHPESNALNAIYLRFKYSSFPTQIAIIGLFVACISMF